MRFMGGWGLFTSDREGSIVPLGHHSTVPNMPQRHHLKCTNWMSGRRLDGEDWLVIFTMGTHSLRCVVVYRGFRATHCIIYMTVC